MCTVRFSYKMPGKCSLRRRRKLTSVSNVCKAAPRSLFWVLNGLNKVPELRFEFPFIVIGKSTMAFLTGQSWRILKFWYTGGAKNKDFWNFKAACWVQSGPKLLKCRKIPKISPSKYKPPKLVTQKNQNGKFTSSYKASPIDFETQISLRR